MFETLGNKLKWNDGVFLKKFYATSINLNTQKSTYILISYELVNIDLLDLRQIEGSSTNQSLTGNVNSNSFYFS